jgi:hypothetical protein
MGKKTPSPSATRSEISDLPVDAATSDCPLKRKGDIEIEVLWQRDNSPIAGVTVNLTGPTPGAKATNSKGRATFKSRQPGSYDFTVDLSAAAKGHKLREVSRSPTNAIRDKKVTKTVLVEEYGSLRVEVRRDEDGQPGELLQGADVVSISGGGIDKQNLASFTQDDIPAGKVTLSLKLSPPRWTSSRGQDYAVVIEPGKETVKVLLALEMSWMEVKLHDLDLDAPIHGAVINADVTQGKVAVATTDQGVARRAVNMGGAGFDVTSITTSGKVYIFEEVG